MNNEEIIKIESNGTEIVATSSNEQVAQNIADSKLCDMFDAIICW